MPGFLRGIPILLHRIIGNARPRHARQAVSSLVRGSSIAVNVEFVDLTVKLGAKDYGTYAAYRTQKESAWYSGAVQFLAALVLFAVLESRANAQPPALPGAVPLELVASSLNDAQSRRVCPRCLWTSLGRRKARARWTRSSIACTAMTPRSRCSLTRRASSP